MTPEDCAVSPAEPLLDFPEHAAGGDQALDEAMRRARPIEPPLEGHLLRA